MKTKLLYLLLLFVMFVGSFFIADHFDRNSLYLPKEFTQGMRWLESLFFDVQEVKVQEIKAEGLVNSSVNPKPKPKKIVKASKEPERNYTHVEVGNRNVCVDTSLGEVKYKKVGNIYTWTDENNVYHVSDQVPEHDQYELFNYAGEKVFDYFTLDLNTKSLPYNFNQQLTVKLNKLFKLYGKLLDASSLKKVDINLRVYRSKTAFEQVKKQHKMSSADNISGFYSHRTNKAYIVFKNNERTMRTSAHEATHAINRAIIGYSPRWLNEGLAEYSEFIQVVANSSTVSPNTDWTKKYYISKNLLPLDTLFSASNNQWRVELSQRLYATSWAFVYFMMENTQRRDILAKLIKIEQQNICNMMDAQTIEQSLGMPLKELQKEFSRWSTSRLKKHSI